MKILNYLTAFKLKVSSAITAMLPDRKNIEKPMFFSTFWDAPGGVGGGCTYGGLAYLPCFRRFVSPYIRPRPLSSGRDQLERTGCHCTRQHARDGGNRGHRLFHCIVPEARLLR